MYIHYIAAIKVLLNKKYSLIYIHVDLEIYMYINVLRATKPPQNQQFIFCQE